MRAATVVQQLCKSYRACFKFYCMLYFTCDRSLTPRGLIDVIAVLSAERRQTLGRRMVTLCGDATCSKRPRATRQPVQKAASVDSKLSGLSNWSSATMSSSMSVSPCSFSTWQLSSLVLSSTSQYDLHIYIRNYCQPVISAYFNEKTA